MRFHTNSINAAEIHRALTDTGLHAEGVRVALCEVHNSRSHRVGFEITLRAEPGRDRNGRARRNPASGVYGFAQSFEKAATYDEWGIFMARLFEMEPDAKWSGAYKDASDFHKKTRYEFA